MDEQIDESKARAKAEGFLIAASVARSAHQEWVRRHDALKEWQTKELKGVVSDDVNIATDKTFINYVRSHAEQDEEMLKEFKALTTRFTMAKGDTMQREIYRIFKKTFQNMCSRPTVVADKDDKHNEAIVCGSYGFAKRYNVQASEIHGFSQLASIFDRREQVAQGMLEHRTLRKWKVRFDKFCELVPDLKAMADDAMSLKLEKPIMMPIERSNSREVPKLGDKIVFEEHSLFRIEEDTGQKNYYGGYVQIYDTNITSYETAIVYYQLRPMLKDLLEKYKAAIKPMVEKSESALENLKAEFGRFIFMESV